LPSKIDTKEISNLAMAFKAMRTRIRGLLTAIRLSENSLKDSLWAMNEAQRIGQVGTYVTDIKTGFWQGSEVLDDIFGIDATFKKTIPNWDSLVAPESRQELLDYYYQVISGDGNFHKEYEVIRPSDGQRVWVEALGQVSFDEAGDPEFLRGTISDIHKRKTAELALQLYKNQLEELVRQKTAEVERQKDQLQLISDVLPGTVYQFMRTAQGESKFLYLSKGIGSLYEVNATEALKDGDLLTRCILPEDRQSHSESIDRSYQELSEWEHWHRIMTPSGKLKWVRGRASPHKIADGSVVWTGFLVDVTEWKKVEETAQAADRSKSEFLANMSHEIRTPMSGVIGMVDILLQTPLSPRQQHMLTTVANSSQTLLDILNDILDFSKIEAGKMMVEQIPARLREVADSVLQLMQSKASEKGMTLSMAISPDLPAAIYTDPTRLRQVLLNLLGNAIKFTPPDAVGADGVTLTLEPGALPDGQPAVLLRVRDHGIGMDAEVQSRLFMSFNQADASTSRQFGGTGLGLSISRRLVTLMGGTISVQSAPGAGSEFTVALPMQEAFVEKTNSDASDVQLQFHSGTITADQAAALGQLILVAEDNETNREVIEEQLRLLGYACEIAHDGAIALQTWKAAPSRYALLLTDGHMPQMDGFELTKAIRDAEAPGKRMPIIAITANAMQGEDQRCLTIGMDDYLSKPMRLRELASMLKKWLPIGDTQDRNATVVDCQPTRPVAPELADWNSLTLGQLVGDNPAIHRRLLEKFLANANRQVLEIGTVLAARKFKEVAALAHMLKSAARSVGALALGELCQQIEATGRDDDAHACTELTQKLPAIFALAQQAIQEHLDS
jgi:PAS domain S-box-containing protein